MIVLVLGRRELGKTTLASFLAHRTDHNVTIDPRRIHDGGTVFQGFTLADQSDADDALAEPIAEIVIQPEDLIQDNAKIARWIRRWLAAHPHRHLAIVLDEAALLDLREWDFLFRTSARARVHFYLTAHRPQDIPTFVRAIADDWCVFRTTQPRDLEAIADRCGESFARRVQSLKPRQFLRWDDATSDPNKQITAFLDPRVWYRPIGPVDVAAQGNTWDISGESLAEPSLLSGDDDE